MNYRRILWTVGATGERKRILRGIAEQDKAAAKRMNQRFKASVARLQTFPGFGRPGDIPGTRCLTVHKNYQVIYQVEEEFIEVLAVHHVKRLAIPML
ncbi:type II toxin-antitoxin system RelE/ParE family toxin [Pandoraea fibrosis]|uniref:Addiction module toxin RelE n=1 Tax=Pandoraea fibrosis TaxID=1891094 RepID=A0A5E4VTG2_9BURK|nr:type II toxin-antitoxin system RelE/ParE family toxin [Pandoraea fibrosis]VVE14766.1 addiction module toxin RelE [Pandoraea fibrosis]